MTTENQAPEGAPELNDDWAAYQLGFAPDRDPTVMASPSNQVRIQLVLLGARAALAVQPDAHQRSMFCPVCEARGKADAAQSPAEGDVEPAYLAPAGMTSAAYPADLIGTWPEHNRERYTVKLYARPAHPQPKGTAQTIKLGSYGQAFDLAGDRRAYTYKHQPGNQAAWRIGEASSRVEAGGDLIDRGLSLLKTLEAGGFGVFELGDVADTPSPAPAQPIDMVLHCPSCGLQHVDAPDERTEGWMNEPHRSHLCHGCGHIWRPADVPTNGVQAVQTKGKADSPIRSPAVAPEPKGT